MQFGSGLGLQPAVRSIGSLVLDGVEFLVERGGIDISHAGLAVHFESDGDAVGSDARAVVHCAVERVDNPLALCRAVVVTAFLAQDGMVGEVGVDEIVPVIGERSERRIFKPERSRKIALSAMKQSLKAQLPIVAEPVSVKDFIKGTTLTAGGDRPLPLPAASRPYPGKCQRVGAVATTATQEIKMICYCFEGETLRRSIEDVLSEAAEGANITIMIGPEGDFSPEEARLAVENGYIPVHLGPSRLRTETAAVTAATAVYLHYIK